MRPRGEAAHLARMLPLGHAQLGDAWESLRERSVAILETGNESEDAFVATSRYALITITKRG